MVEVAPVNNRTVVGRVWNRPVNPGLMFGQMIQTTLTDILNIA